MTYIYKYVAAIRQVVDLYLPIRILMEKSLVGNHLPRPLGRGRMIKLLVALAETIIFILAKANSGALYYPRPKGRCN